MSKRFIIWNRWSSIYHPIQLCYTLEDNTFSTWRVGFNSLIVYTNTKKTKYNNILKFRYMYVVSSNTPNKTVNLNVFQNVNRMFHAWWFDLVFLWSKFFETRLIRHQYNALVIFQIFMYISLELKPTFFKSFWTYFLWALNILYGFFGSQSRSFFLQFVEA